MTQPLDSHSRRDFLYAGVTTGVALAVAPGTAFAVSTSDNGIEAETTVIPTNGGKMPAYRAAPKGKGPFPVVLVVHEIFGVHNYIQDVCRRLAKEGYLAVAPYLYFRQGDVTKLKSIDEIRPVVAKVPQAQVHADLDATVKWLESSKAADVDRLGITGFCWGGSVVWLYSAHNPSVKAGVAWYGRLVGDATPVHSKFAVDIAPQLKTPILGLYGGKDKGIPLESIEKMRSALKKGKSKSEIVVYPDAEHGFHADYRPSYNEKAATDGWSKALKWFKQHLA